MKKPTSNLTCGVCRKLGAYPVQMESGVEFAICTSCKEDRHMRAEAERRAKR